VSCMDLMLAALGALLLVILISLLRRNRCRNSPIKLEDLLIGDDGRLSKAAAVMMGAFAMTTWLIVYLTVTGKITEGYFTAYLGAWVAPTVARVIFGKSSAAPTTTPSGGAQS